MVLRSSPGDANVDISFVLIVFYEMRVFSQIPLKSRRGKSVHGRIPWAQNSGNPCTKLIISLFDVRKRFFVF